VPLPSHRVDLKNESSPRRRVRDREIPGLAEGKAAFYLIVARLSLSLKNRLGNEESNMAKKTPVSQIVSWLVFLMMACGFFPLPLIASAPATGRAECKALAISLAAEDPAVARVGRMLASRVEEHSGVKPTFSQAPGACRVELALQKGIGEEGFRIEDAPGGVRVVGNDRRGLLYGAGKFLRSSTYHEGSLTLGVWRGTSVPETPFRGIYFATHFFNWYHEAPIPEVERYVEDLGLWGYNTVVVWYDMHHFKSIQDPEAQGLLKRLNSLLRVAKNVGLQTSIVLVVNEAYQDTPQEMLADWTGAMTVILASLGRTITWNSAPISRERWPCF
jgi:hypothetical protein